MSPVIGKLGLVPASHNPKNTGDLVPRDQPRSSAFLRHFIEYALLRGSGDAAPSMGPAVKPCGRNGFRAFQRAKLKPRR